MISCCHCTGRSWPQKQRQQRPLSRNISLSQPVIRPKSARFQHGFKTTAPKCCIRVFRFATRVSSAGLTCLCSAAACHASRSSLKTIAAVGTRVPLAVVGRAIHQQAAIGTSAPTPCIQSRPRNPTASQASLYSFNCPLPQRLRLSMSNADMTTRSPAHTHTQSGQPSTGRISPTGCLQSTSSQPVARSTAPHQRLGLRCNGYVGEGTAPAGEYHHADFSWEDHCKEVLALVASDPVRWRHISHDRLPASKQQSYPLPAHKDLHDNGSKTLHSNDQGRNPSTGAQDDSSGSAHGEPDAQGQVIPTQKIAYARQDSSQSCGNHADAEAALPSLTKRGCDSSAEQPQQATHESRENSDGGLSPYRLGAQGPASVGRQPPELSQGKPAASAVGDSNNLREQLQVPSESASNQVLGPASQPGACADDTAACGNQTGKGTGGYSSSRWEAFHAQDNRSGPFYKERRWAPGTVRFCSTCARQSLVLW